MTVLEHLQAIAKEKHLKATITDSDLDKSFKDLGLDSLDVFDIIVNLEKRLNVQFSDETLMTIKTINELITAAKKIMPT